MSKNPLPVCFALLLSLIGLLFTLTANAQNSFPAFPPKDVNFTMDRDQMLSQLGITFPTLPPKTGDKNVPPYTWPADSTNPDGNWRDSANHIITRSNFGLWNNYDQDKVGVYTPIDLLKMKNGTLISTSKEWWLRRRPEIMKDVQTEIWGWMPPDSILPKVTFTTTITTGGKGNNAYIQKEITGKIDISRYPQVRDVPVISATLRVPASATGPVPVMIIYGGFGNITDAYWNRTNPNGWGVCIFNPVALQPDNGTGLTSYLIGLVNKGNWRKPTDWGSLVAWAWGIGRLIDYFETDKLVDAKKIGLSGHSRYGKATIVATAYEQRIAIAFPSCGGALGPAMIRRHWGQNLENPGWDREYHWVAGNFFNYMGPLHEGSYMPRKVELLTVDAHSLLSLCAPRPVFLNGGTQDSWTDYYGTYLSAKGATPVYQLLGKKGIIMNDKWPVEDKVYIDGTIGYRYHIGGHTDAPDWPAFFEFAAKHIKASILETSSTHLTLRADDKSSAVLKIRANEPWKILEPQKWITVSKTASAGTDSVMITAAANTAASARTATLVITTNGRKQTVIVNQGAANPAFSLSRTDLSIGEKNNSNASLGITSNTAWTVTNTADWLSVDDAGVNNKTISFVAQANPIPEKRIAKLTIDAVGAGPQTVTVTQAEGAPVVTTSATTITLARDAGSSASFFTIANTSWTLDNAPDWIKINPASGKAGFSQVNVIATENTGIARNATITINAKNMKPVTITVVQAAK
jgi:hypothetical protein